MNQVTLQARRATMVLALVCVGLAASASGTCEGGSQSIECVDVSLQANVVVVQVHNSGDEPRMATLNAEVRLVGGGVEYGATHVYVTPGDSEFASILFSAQVDSITKLGLEDWGDPF